MYFIDVAMPSDSRISPKTTEKIKDWNYKNMESKESDCYINSYWCFGISTCWFIIIKLFGKVIFINFKLPKIGVAQNHLHFKMLHEKHLNYFAVIGS